MIVINWFDVYSQNKALLSVQLKVPNSQVWLFRFSIYKLLIHQEIFVTISGVSSTASWQTLYKQVQLQGFSPQ